MARALSRNEWDEMLGSTASRRVIDTLEYQLYVARYCRQAQSLYEHPDDELIEHYTRDIEDLRVALSGLYRRLA